MQRTHLVLATAFVSLFGSYPAPHVWAQAPATGNGASNGTLSGTVADATGARVPGAKLHVSRENTQRDATADAVGHFSLRLPAGRYAVTVTASGFDALERKGIEVGAGAQVSLPLVLAINAEATEINVNSADADRNGAGSNQTAISLSGAALATLSDDDATFQQQIQAMAGGGDDTGGNQLMVDGFSGGRFPPKTAIREVRINSNPFSAQYDSLGFGRIEVFTKPGADTFHGDFDASGNNQSFNARNPYTGPQPPYHDLYFDGNFNGPIGKKTSFFLAGNRADQQNNAVVNAVTNTGPVSQAVPNPQNSNSASVRVDRQVTTNNVLTGRYEWANSSQANSGVGLLVLPEQGVSTSTATQTLQLGDTHTLGAATVLETRFEYVRTRLRQTPNSTAPAIIVQGSFSGGGSPAQAITDNGDHYELQEYVSRVFGPHLVRVGGRFRFNREANASTAGFNGAFTFPYLTYDPANDGPVDNSFATGLPSQFNVTTGTPAAKVSTADGGVYAEDEWKLRKGLTADLGFRFETQTAIPDHANPAPRVGLAYSLAPGSRKEPIAVLRVGFGMFYDRFDLGNLLTAVRQNGTSQLAYFAKDPGFYCPDEGCVQSHLGGLSSTEPTIYRVNPSLRTAEAIVSSSSAEHSFGSKGSISATYLFIRRDHQYLSRNINAPLPGTYNPSDPTTGVRPLGGTQNIYQFSSDGIRRGQVMFVNADLNPTKRLSVWAFYNLQYRRGDSFGANAFPSNEYDLAQDYGRTTATRNRIFVGTWYNGPKGVNGGLFLRSFSGTPYNITTGTDSNGDTIYNDRPAFATDLTRGSVVRTRLGNFDTAPIAGQTIIPINYGMSPAYASLQMVVSKEFRFGPRPAPPTPAVASQDKAPLPEPRYAVRFGLEGANITNHTNPGVPVGILSSPFFGKSISLADNFSGITAANRTLTLHGSFSF